MRQLADQKATEIGSTVTLECELSKPGVKVEWRCGDVPIAPGPKYEIVLDGAVHRLVIRDIDSDDTAAYSAVVSDISSSANVLVEGE